MGVTLTLNNKSTAYVTSSMQATSTAVATDITWGINANGIFNIN